MDQKTRKGLKQVCCRFTSLFAVVAAAVALWSVTTAAICLLPTAQPSTSGCRLVIAFASGVLLTVVAGFLVAS